MALEDSINGIKAGIAAGCKTCAIPSLFTGYEDFSIAHLVAKILDDEIIKTLALAGK